MKIEYKLNKEDFLIHLWYQLESNSAFQNAKSRYSYEVPKILIIIGFIFYLFSGDYTALIILLFISIIWFFVSPIFYNKEREKEFDKKVNELIRSRNSENATIVIEKDFIISKEDFYESKHYKTEVANLTEISTHFIINFKDIEGKMIIPKKYIIEQKKLIDKFIKMDIQYIDNSNWRR